MKFEVKIAGKGQVFEAAPKGKEPRGFTKIPGSTPRPWETRGPRECATIVGEVRSGPGWAIHLACCMPVEPDSRYPYCTAHWPFIAPKVTGKAYTRGLRSFIK